MTEHLKYGVYRPESALLLFVITLMVLHVCNSMTALLSQDLMTKQLNFGISHPVETPVWGTKLMRLEHCRCIYQNVQNFIRELKKMLPLLLLFEEGSRGALLLGSI